MLIVTIGADLDIVVANIVPIVQGVFNVLNQLCKVLFPFFIEIIVLIVVFEKI